MGALGHISVTVQLSETASVEYLWFSQLTYPLTLMDEAFSVNVYG